jgi:hypothetical protein
VVVVTELATQFFRAPVPSVFRAWPEQLRPSVRVWLENYARTWVFGKHRKDQFSLFPTTKLVLFLHQQYLPDSNAQRDLIRMRLVPCESFVRRARSIPTKSLKVSESRGRQIEHILIRFLFHVTGGLRYLWEIPRWRRLNKATAGWTPSSPRDLTSPEIANVRNPESTIYL